VHGKDEVKKLPITVQEEGLMYNPINMHIEDRDRLYQKDLRDKNKRKRYEVRYDVEAETRKEGMAQFAFFVARKTDNTAVRADGWHHRSDALSSVVLLIGLIFHNRFSEK
jgi:hypothetical protein